MIITKKLSMLTVVIAIALAATLSSFINHNPAPLKGEKASALTTALKSPTIYWDYYWNGTDWVATSMASCSGNGAICTVGFNNPASGYTVKQMCDDASTAYVATGNLSNPSVNSGNVTVHGKLCFVVEKDL
jgi:hypothetical protein